MPSYRQMRLDFFRQELAAHDFEVTTEELMAAYYQARRTFDRLWREEISFDAALGIDEMLHYLGTTVPAATRQRIIAYFEEVINQGTLVLLPGVREALYALAQHYRIGLISDTAWTPGRVLREHLQRNGIADLFDVLVFSGEVGYCKPNARLFRQALDALAVDPPACMHIGDLQFTDIKGAKALGCRAAWIHRPGYLDNDRQDYQPDLVVRRVADLPALLLDSGLD